MPVTKLYDMAEQLSKGEKAELLLDAFFSTKYRIQDVSRSFQRVGIDRTFTSKATGKSFTVEYKTDWTAGRTGNVFLEAEYVGINKQGWVFTSTADWLMYFVPDRATIYIIAMRKLRRLYQEWSKQFRMSPPVQNEGYYATGLLVPIPVFAAQCAEILGID